MLTVLQICMSCVNLHAANLSPSILQLPSAARIGEPVRRRLGTLLSTAAIRPQREAGGVAMVEQFWLNFSFVRAEAPTM